METEKKIIDEEIKIPHRVFAKRITMGILEDADIPIEKLDDLDFKSTKDLGIARKILNALVIEGPPITRDIDPLELLDMMPQLEEVFKGFLERSRRFEAAKEMLKSKRSPKL